MPRHKRGHILVNVLPGDAECRVVGYRQYGKLTRRIDRHIKNMHKISRKEHDSLPQCKLSVFKEGATRKEYMKYRKPEKCFVHGCRKYGQYFNSLTKHLKTVHKITRDQYRDQRLRVKDRKAPETGKLIGEDRQFLNQLKTDLYLSYIHSEGGCPSTRDERYEYDRSNIKIRDLESMSYPKIVYFKIYTESCLASIISNEVKTFKLPEDEPHCVTYNVKKLFVSASHQEWFRESIEESEATITKGKEPHELQYFCGICPFQHTVQLVATPVLTPS